MLAQRLITEFPEYYKYFSEMEFTYGTDDKGKPIKQGNRNPLLYKNIGADGIKTGHTDAGGYGLAGTAVRDGRRVDAPDAGRAVGIGWFFYRLIAPMAVFLVFLGALYLTVDSTVGERERGSWEALLTAPLARWELVLGKGAAAALVTLLTVALDLAAFRLVLGGVAGLHPTVAAPPTTAVFAQVMLLMVPLVALSSSSRSKICACTQFIENWIRHNDFW